MTSRFVALMLVTSSLAILNSAAICKQVQGPSAQPRTVPSYPPTGGNTFTVPALDQSLNIQNLVLPDDFVLKLAPDVKQIDWTVGAIQIGSHVLFDVSSFATPSKPGKPGTQNQATYCRVGDNGSTGAKGARGGNSIPVRITQISSIQNGGSLWIKTDGALGGRGGDGQDGQQGGGPHLGFPSCRNAKGGGAGGPSGAGGAGGTVSVVFIAKAENPKVPYVPQEVGTKCGPSSAPPDWLHDTKPSQKSTASIIVIYGSPGCVGHSGAKGRDGKSGLVGHD